VSQETLFKITPGKEIGIFPKSNYESNKLLEGDRAIHDWYRFVLSFPPHLVRNYLSEFEIAESNLVLDPFCGTGTTLVECKKSGIESVGIEVNPVARFASAVKVDWSPDPEGLIQHAEGIFKRTLNKLKRDGIGDDFSGTTRKTDGLLSVGEDEEKILLKNSISPLPLHKVLMLHDTIKDLNDSNYTSHELLALAKTLVETASNLRFGPEIGLGQIKTNAPVLTSWIARVKEMADDIGKCSDRSGVPARTIDGDSRKLADNIARGTVDAVITSPPYPNEKDYTRITRLESVVLGFIRNKAELRDLKKSMIRSNTRTVYKADEDDKWVEQIPEVQRIAAEIEKRRKTLGKTSGFERLYHRVVKLYFGGMSRHLSEMRAILKPGAKLVYVVGDQASYLRVMIRTGTILGSIAESLGYKVVRTDLFRTRIATATKEQLREEALILEWQG
jgi:DNA modification methylase